MANKKISQLTPKGSALAGTDLLEVSVFNGATYDTKSLTGANVVSGLQPTLFSGTNIKTINSTSLLGSGDIVISTGLTVGTTPIASGTVGRVLFEGTGNVLQEDAKLFWDNTNKKLGIGATPDVNTVLDVRSAGTLATDLAFRVRNSANTANLYQAQGDGQHWFNPFQTSETVNDVIIGGSNLANSKGGLRIATGNGGLTLIGRPNTQNPSIISGNGNFAFETVANGTFAYAQFNVSVAQASNVYITTLASNTNQNSGIRLSAGGDKGLFLGVVGTDFLNINTTSGSVNIGYGSTLNSNAKLDIKAQGALYSDIALRINNSANSVDLFTFRGSGAFLFRNNGNTSSFYYDAVSQWDYSASGTTLSVVVGANSRIVSDAGAASIRFGSSSHSMVSYKAGNFQFEDNTIIQTSGVGGISLKTGTDPSASTADRFNMYSQDITAGNAAPHFRTENGAVVKIYQQTTAVTPATVVSGSGGVVKHDDTFDGYTLEKVVKALRNTGLLA